MTHPEVDRYDFSYWPPVPIESLGVVPAESAEPDELCRGLLYITDRQRLKAVYASDEWVDIQDFWLAANPPRETQTQVDDTFKDLPDFLHPPIKVWSRYHLSGPSYAFSLLAYDVAFYGERDAQPDQELTYEEFEDSDTYKTLFHKIFNQWAKVYDRKHLLIERDQLVQIDNGTYPLPSGASQKSRTFYSRVVARQPALASQEPNLD